MTDRARIFKNGASQAVRLPKEFRFDCDEVLIKRIGSALLLFPEDAAWHLMEEGIDEMSDDFMSERSQAKRAEKRKPL